MLWTKVGFRECDDGWAFNTRITVGYTVPRWSIYSLLSGTSAYHSFIHTFWPPSCERNAVVWSM